MLLNLPHSPNLHPSLDHTLTHQDVPASAGNGGAGRGGREVQGEGREGEQPQKGTQPTLLDKLSDVVVR